MFRQTTVALALPFVLSGCSALFVRTPSRPPEPGRAFACNDTPIAPVADLLVAAGSILVGGLAAGHHDENSFVNLALPSEFAVLYFGSGIIFAASAIYGFSKVGDCDAAVYTGRSITKVVAR